MSHIVRNADFACSGRNAGGNTHVPSAFVHNSTHHSNIMSLATSVYRTAVGCDYSGMDLMKLAALFSDHAVLQREKPIVVWGWAKPLAEVTVKLGKQISRGPAGSDGRFFVQLPAMPAGGPLTLEARCGRETVRAKDIWIGEVWLASGQSNMEFTVDAMGKADESEMLAKSQNIRMIKVPCSTFGGGRQSDLLLANGKPAAAWECPNRLSVATFSAVAAHFAKFLADANGVKVGIINSSWGGTYIEAWTSRETLMQNPVMLTRVKDYESFVYAPPKSARIVKLKPGQPGYRPMDPGNKGVKKGWANLNFDDSSWEKMNLPGAWTRQGHPYSGIFWFRKVIDVPAAWAGKDLTLCPGAIDKSDITYFNGKQVGATGRGFDEQFWNVQREYKIPGKLVKAGRNVIAVRAYSFMYDGGLIGPEPMMVIKRAKGSAAPISIAGEWSYTIEQNFGVVTPAMMDAGPGNPNTPYMLFDNMIAPLLPYGIRGAIWYQGCSNTGRGTEYEKLLKDMIRDWRFHFAQGDFPFYVVQIANYRANCMQPDGWMRVREAQMKVLSEANTGLAVTIDIGESADIHPKNKKEVGRRLSLWALRDVHGKDVEVSGPLFESARVEGSSIRLKFSHITGGLVAKGGELAAFTIADGSKNFVPAKAVIDGESVVVSCADIQTPLHVRYAWSEDPIDANLYNGAGLPASPFRTDVD